MRQFLREWTPDEEEERSVLGAVDDVQLPEERSEDMKERDEIINHKHRQIIWKAKAKVKSEPYDRDRERSTT